MSETVPELDNVPDPTPVEAALIVLSLITGEEWDEQKLIKTADTLQEVAFATLLKQGMARSEAASIVAERVERFKASIPEPEPKVVFEELSTPTMPRAEDVAARVRARMVERGVARAAVPADNPQSSPSS